VDVAWGGQYELLFSDGSSVGCTVAVVAAIVADSGVVESFNGEGEGGVQVDRALAIWLTETCREPKCVNPSGGSEAWSICNRKSEVGELAMHGHVVVGKEL